MANDNVELLRLGRRIQAERRTLGFSQKQTLNFGKSAGKNSKI
jgi:hypothetical protein